MAHPVMVAGTNQPTDAIRRLVQTLPVAPTPLIGRETELVALRRLLLRPDVRLVTLTGAPGTGKTRLAVALAATVIDDLAGGAGFIPLEAVREPKHVLDAIAGVVGAHGGTEPVLATLSRAFAGREMLLVLDNLEQVLGAAADLAALLAACPGLTLLVTSRAPLRVRWEHEVPLPPLALPPRGSADVAQIQSAAAVQLFLARAQAAYPAFRLDATNAGAVATICARLDGLPLAIELAAVRMKLFPPQALLDRLERRLEFLTRAPRDAPARHQTLRAAVAWSYELLTGEEQVLFRRLGVFLGGCTLESAEAVAGDELPGVSGAETPSGEGWGAQTVPQVKANLLEGVASLVDQSLLVREETPNGEVRLRMLETVREYALEQLEASGEAFDLRQRHAMCYLAMADRSYDDIRTVRMRMWLERVRRDLANLRAALEWSLASADEETALRLAGSLVFFWWADGHVAEGRQWIERALAAGETAPMPTRLRALLAAGALAFLQGDHEGAAAALAAGHALLREAPQVPDLAWTIAMLANLQPDFERRRTLAEESLALCRQAGDDWGAAFALHELGLLARDQGDRARAASLLGEAVTRFRDLDDRSSMARTMLNLGAVVQRQGAHEQAAAGFAEGLTILTELDEPEGIARSLQRIGELAVERGEAECGVRLLAAAEAQFHIIGVRFRPRERARVERHLAAARTQLGDEAFAAVQADGRVMFLEAAVACAREYLAGALSSKDDASGMEDGSRVASRMAPPAPPSVPSPHGLTDRQLDVLRLIAAGKTTKEIAAVLVVSGHTVERHITHVYQKTGARSRAEATAYALRHGLADLAQP